MAADVATSQSALGPLCTISNTLLWRGDRLDAAPNSYHMVIPLTFDGSILRVNPEKLALDRLVLRRLGFGGGYLRYSSTQLGCGGGYTGPDARHLSSTLPGG